MLTHERAGWVLSRGPSADPQRNATSSQTQHSPTAPPCVCVCVFSLRSFVRSFLRSYSVLLPRLSVRLKTKLIIHITLIRLNTLFTGMYSGTRTRDARPPAFALFACLDAPRLPCPEFAHSALTARNCRCQLPTCFFVRFPLFSLPLRLARARGQTSLGRGGARAHAPPRGARSLATARARTRRAVSRRQMPNSRHCGSG